MNTIADMKKQQILSWAAEALERDEFIVMYQPKFSVNGLNTIGAEALVRWRRPNGQMISPADFITVFEEYGYIQRLDFLVLRKVCAMLANSLLQGILPVPVSINFSRLHIYNPLFADQVNQIVKHYGLPTGLIEIEITESAFTADVHLFAQVIEQFHAYGYTVSMDDFGTGFSSLNHLMDMPVDVLKLDKDFLHLTNENRRRAICIISSIIQMAKALDITVVAEGVETVQELEILRQCGCGIGQGYYFSRPVPEEEFISFLPQAYAV